VVPTLALALALPACGDDGGAQSSLAARVEASRIRAGAPAIAAAVVDVDQIDTAIDGVRLQGGPDRALITDAFHLGSLTKSMTSTVAASLVQDGLARWDLRLLDVLPELAAAARSEYRDVTLGQLLQHRSGLPGFELFSDLDAVPPAAGSASQRRLAFAQWVVTRAPASNAGEFGYSNAGYVVASLMMERVAAKSWEDLLSARLFAPLELRTAGLGWPAAAGANAPVGHYSLDGTTLIAHDDASEAFPDLMSPAGNVAMSVGELGRYVQAHLRGLEGRDDLLPAAAIAELHESTYPEVVPGLTYAFGWLRSAAEGVRVDAHDGSADTFYAVMALSPDLGRAAVAVANAATDQVSDELTALVNQLVQP
jgi:CubicO group peptidase (beta-lactamase class C family)